MHLVAENEVVRGKEDNKLTNYRYKSLIPLIYSNCYCSPFPILIYFFPREDVLGKLVGKWLLQCPVAEGSFGQVWVATDRRDNGFAMNLERTNAKYLKLEVLLMQKANAAQARNICQLYDHGNIYRLKIEFGPILENAIIQKK